MLLHICSNIMKISLTVQSFRTDTIFKLNIPKENNAEKNDGLWFLFSAYCPMMLYICSKYYKSILDDIKVIESNKIFIKIFQRCKISQRLLVALQFLFSAHCLILVYFCTQFHENIFDGFQVVEWTQFSLENFQRGIIP